MRDKILKVFYDHSTVLPEGKCSCGWEPIVEMVGDLVIRYTYTKHLADVVTREISTFTLEDVTRVEVHGTDDHLVKWGVHDVLASVQDDGRTFKLFYKKDTGERTNL